jgi:hypothetical protein
MELYDEGDEPTRRARGPRHAPRVDPERATRVERRMAAMHVRRLCDQHECTARKTGSCDHPNHERDMHFLREMLSHLGLDAEYPAYSPDDHRLWLRWLGQSGPPEEESLPDAA